MSDPEGATPSVDSDAPAKKPVELPKLAYVKGGTGSAASEKLYEQRFRDAEKRRDIADAERALSAGQKSVDAGGQQRVHMPGAVDGDSVSKEALEALAGPDAAAVRQGDMGATQYTSQMTAHPEVPKAYILLTYLTRAGDVAYVNGQPVQCLADLIVGADPTAPPTELCLILVCPRCEQDSHKHHQDNQLRIFQSNKNFEFVPSKGDPYIRFEGATYRSAGMIVESEPFSCGDCGWRARIDHNRVRPD